MDPNTTLDELRKLVVECNSENCTVGRSNTMAYDLSNLFASLDQWLSRGGALPLAWGHREGQSLKQSMRGWLP